MATDTLPARYIAAWNETAADARWRAVADLWRADGTYSDSLAEVVGHDAIADLIGAAQAQFAGFRFRLTGGVDAHHGVVRFAWELGPDGGEAPIAGSDVAVVDDDGRLIGVYGFLDRVPATV